MFSTLLNRAESRIKDEVYVFQMRLRAKLLALRFRNNSLCANTQGFFLYHETTPSMEQHFERLVRETKGLITWHRLFNPGNWATPQSEFEYQHASSLMPWRFDQMARHGGIVPGGFADLAILPVVLASGAQFSWVMEYDVDFAGNWEEFFHQFASNGADLLTTKLASRLQAPDWFHWPSSQMPPSIPKRRRLRSFNPLMRLSRRFALEYVKSLRDPRWQGNYEFTLPTIAARGGFVVEDLGGKGRYTPLRRRGKIYTASSKSNKHELGTFVWRPATARYFATQPELFPQPKLLYHPCKPEAARYEGGASSTEIYGRRKLEKGGRVAVAMATFNGARHLDTQLNSLARQSRLPDELIVGDDCSSDETLSIIQEFAERAPFPVRVKHRSKRMGFGANFRDIASQADCDLMLFCDQDDIWHEHKIRLLSNAASQSTALAYSHDLTVFYSEVSDRRKPIPSYFDHLRKIGLDASLCGKGCALAVRPDFFKTWGWPPDNTGITHDAWITLISTAMGQRSLVEAVLIKHQIHGKNASGWIVSAHDARRYGKAAPNDLFGSMLDFYVWNSHRRWVRPLQQALETVGMDVNPRRAEAALKSLETTG